MVVHSFHLARAGVLTTLGAMIHPPRAGVVAGLQHAECMMPMQLGLPMLSPRRWQLGRLAMFAAWESEAAIEEFLVGTRLGRALAAGWHVRLQFLRRWGHVAAFDGLQATAADTDLDAPVVAVTVARLRMLQVPRFIRWGLPVERLVRDHPGTTLALAATRPSRTIATFTVWETARAMLEMVQGHGAIAAPQRHAIAMRERRRKDFHVEFTTLRFTCLGEYGAWEGRTGIVPRRAAASLGAATDTVSPPSIAPSSVRPRG